MGLSLEADGEFCTGNQDEGNNYTFWKKWARIAITKLVIGMKAARQAGTLEKEKEVSRE